MARKRVTGGRKISTATFKTPSGDRVHMISAKATRGRSRAAPRRRRR